MQLQHNRQNFLNKSAFVIVLVLWAVWILRSGVWLLTLLSKPAMTPKRIGLGVGYILLSILGGIALYVLFRKIRKPWLILLLILCAAFTLRLGYIALIPTTPQSDYHLYHTMAREFAKGDYHSAYARPMGYPLLLSIFYHWLPDAVMGRILNVILSTLTVLIGFYLGKQIGAEPFGLITAAVLAVYPAEIMMTSVLATETATSLCLTISLLGLFRYRNNFGSKTPLLLTGVFLSLSFILRTAFLIYLPLYLFLIGWQERHNFKALVNSLTWLLLSFVITVLLYLMYCSFLLGYFSLKPLSSAASFSPFLTGTGEIVGNSFAKESKLYSSWPEEERATRSVKTALERILAHPQKAVWVAAKKIDIMFSNDGYAPMWSFYTVKTRFSKTQTVTLRASFDVWAQLTKLLMLILGGAGLIYLWKTDRMVLWMLVFMILITLLPHIILEAQGRYRHQLDSTMALLASAGVRYLWQGIRAGKGGGFLGRFSRSYRGV